MDYEQKVVLIRNGHRVLSDSTLMKMKKEELISEIRCLENNWAAAEIRYENAVKFSEDLIRRANEKDGDR